jgi:hypothetical protein
MSKPNQIDPRGPRFGAAITATLLAVTVFLALDASTKDAAFALLSVVTALFAVGAIFGVSNHPYAWIFKTLVRPRLSAPNELEDATPPRFAQGVGLFVALVGVVLHLAGVELGLVIAAAAAFFAAFLNAAFNYCLGCQIFLGLKRLKVIR